MSWQKIVAYVGYGVGALVAFWATVPDAVHYLVFAMGLDIVTGFLCAVSKQTISSKAAWNGVSKKVATLILIALVYYGGNLMAIGFAPQLVAAVTGFYIYTELISVVENASLLGVPIPDFLRAALLELNPNKQSKFTDPQAGTMPVQVPPADIGSDALQVMKGKQ